jgi:cell division protein FtsW (lipid II flippase)
MKRPGFIVQVSKIKCPDFGDTLKILLGVMGILFTAGVQISWPHF